MELEKSVYRLTDVLVNGAGLQAIIDTAGEELERPVWLVDHDFHYLAVARNAESFDPGLKEALSGATDPQGLVYIHHHHLVEHVNRQVETPYTYFDEIIGRTMIVQTVRIKGILVGYLSTCCKEEMMDNSQLTFLTKASSMISMFLQAEGSSLPRSNKSPVSGILAEILSTFGKNTDHILSRMKAVRYKPAENMCVLMIYQPEEDEGDDSYPWFVIEKRISALFPQSICTQHRDRLIYLLDADFIRTEQTIIRLKEILDSVHLKAACSYRFEHVSKTYQAYLNTLELTAACEQAYPSVSYYAYDAYVLVLAAWYLKGEIQIESIANDMIRKLQQYDERFAQESLETLEAYAKSAFHTKKASKMLHIHDNTLRYRLQKISDITGLHFDSTNDLLQIALALILNRLT